MIKTSTGAALAVALLASAAGTVQAQDAGDWLVRVGVGHVAPNTSDDNLVFEGIELPGYQIDVDSGTSAVFNVSYFFKPNMAIELLAATPFSHDIDGSGVIAGLGKIGEIKHLPPVLSAQYHFRPGASVRPYVGAGLNFTLIYDEETTPSLHEGIVATANGALGTAYTGGETSMEIDNSFGAALQAGVDIDLTDTMFLNFDLRWIDISADATITTVTAEPGLADTTFTSEINADIDPWVFSTTVGWSF